MILIDYSQMVVAAAFAFPKDFEKGKDAAKMIDLLRHTVLNTLLSDKQKHSKQFGDIVLAVDDREYWRRDYFPQYKGARKKNREESKTDWKSIFSIGTQLREEFAETFPYKVIQVPKCEGDDIIAVLTKYVPTEVTEASMFPCDDVRPEILIKSSDGDFAQLHKYKGVRQWNPIMKKFVAKAGKHDLLEKCMSGDTGDGVPNIRTHDNFFMEEGGRQAPITAKIKAAAIAQVEAGEEVHFGDAAMDRNYSRNRNLIDFDCIPQDIIDAIHDKYITTEAVHDKSKIFNYLVKNRCKLLVEHIARF